MSSTRSPLMDRFGRRVEYLRLSVTDRCDLRCTYCMPKGFAGFKEPESWLSFDEIERLVRVFAHLGVQRVRITGGEPLVRKNLAELASRLARLPGIEDLSLSTNAVRLARQAQALREAGIDRINVSLDSLDAGRFRAITGGGKLEKVIAGLMAAKEVGLSPIKINMVVMKGVNDHEVFDMVEFCMRQEFALRFIEVMPMGDTGRAAASRFIDLQEIRQRLDERFALVPTVMPGGGPARYQQVAGTSMKIGFITPLSQHFCAACNRVRLAVDGTLYMCLGQEYRYELRTLLRDGASDRELEAGVRKAIELKPERHEFREKPLQIVRFMSATGG